MDWQTSLWNEKRWRQPQMVWNWILPNQPKCTTSKTGSNWSYSFIYKYHPVYGSPIDRKALQIEGPWSDDGLKLRLMVNKVRYHIHEINLRDIKSADGLFFTSPHGVLHASMLYPMVKPDMAEYKNTYKVSTVSKQVGSHRKESQC